MIFVTLGTHELPFNRLIDNIIKLVEEKVITDKIIVQTGNTEVNSEHSLIDYRTFIPIEEMEYLYDRCTYLITHGGVGGIISGVRRGKPVLAVPRYHNLGEHNCDHQLEIVQEFESEGYIIPFYKEDNIIEKMLKLYNFQPKAYKNQKENVINIIDEFINRK